MEKDSTIKLFEDKRVRIVWDEVSEEWIFSIIDIIEILTDSYRPRKYWSDLKSKLKNGRESTVLRTRTFENEDCRWKDEIN